MKGTAIQLAEGANGAPLLGLQSFLGLPVFILGSPTHPTVPVRCSWQAQVTRGWKSLRTCRAASFLRCWQGGRRRRLTQSWPASRRRAARGWGWGGDHLEAGGPAGRQGWAPALTGPAPPLPARTPPRPEARRGPGAYLGQLRQDAVPPHGRQKVHPACGPLGRPAKARRPDPPRRPGPVGTRRSPATEGSRL